MEVLVKAVAGSHLFGTNTATSDTDFKGIYLPSKEDILLGTASSSVNIKTNNTGMKNSKDDVDVEFYSLQKFMQMLWEGQTVALELLWTPEDKIITKHPFWDELRSHRAELLHKKVTAFIGYCKTQADKYGVKGSRMAAVKKAIEFYSTRPGYHRIGEHEIEFKEQLYGTEHIDFGIQDTKLGPIHYIEICNRKFQPTVKVEYALDALNKLYDSYGHRAKLAESNEGIDWKALSHAYRVCCQAIEILQYGKLSLPLRDGDREMVMAIKLGRVPFKELQPRLEMKLAEVLEWQEMSELPTDFDHQKWCKDFVMKVYKEQVNKD